MTPLLKWVGGKRWLVDDLRKDMPAFRDYYEPFCGGAALFFALAQDEVWANIPIEGELTASQLRSIAGTARPRFLLSDVNRALIDTYEAIRWRHDTVGEHLRAHAVAHRKNPAKRYQHVRSLWNRHTGDAYQRAAAFIYLNRTCFNGLWRVNRRGEFNVPMGRYANPAIYDPEHLARSAKLLELATVECKSAFHVDAAKGDFVYFDPPYDPISQTSGFVSYDVGKFNGFDQDKLAALATKLAAAGVHVMVSNSNTKRVRELYKEFRQRRVKRSGQINSNPGKRGKVAELIITSY